MLHQAKSIVLRVAREIYEGDAPRDDIGGARRHAPAAGWSRLHADESGKITLITTITLLFFLLLICYVGNIGVAVKQKMELQNSADAAAYSSALWMARGMNAVTVANHMLGEATAMVVIVDSFGGKLLEERKKQFSKSSRDYNERFDEGSDFLRENAPPPKISTVSQFFRPFDVQLVDRVSEMLSKDEGNHTAGAAIFDAQLTLKYAFTLCLTVKSVCTVVTEATKFYPPVGVPVESACLIVHMTVSAVVISKIASEWAMLKALERVVQLMLPFKQQIETALIPAISLYGDGASGGAIAGKAPLNRAVGGVLDELKGQYAAQGVTLTILPDASDLRLPLEAEPPPPTKQDASMAERLGEWGMPPPQWSGPYYTHPAMKQIDRVFEPLKRRLSIVKQNAQFLLSFADVVPSWAGPIRDAVRSFEQSLDSLPDLPDYEHGYKDNPSQDPDSKYRLPEFYWQAERKSQWARATYPYVHGFRAPLLGLMHDGEGPLNLGVSNAATFYVHWTDRYTLAKSFEIRSRESGFDADVLKRLRAFLDKYEPRLRALRARFEKARNGPQTFEEVMEFEKDDFGGVSDELGRLADDALRDLGNLQGAETAASLLQKWLAAVTDRDRPSSEAKQSAKFDENSALGEELFRKLVGKTAQVAVLDVLLRELQNVLDELRALLRTLEIGRPHMYILEGGGPDQKGYETWTEDREQAERMFSVLAVAEADGGSIVFGPSVFSSQVERRQTLALAMFYNANGRHVPERPEQGDAALQVDTGWDTLNWRPPVAAPEWGDRKPTKKNGDPSAAFSGRLRAERLDEVQINWQAKLVPLTRTRLAEALRRDKTPENVRRLLKTIRDDQGEELLHH